LPVLAHVGIFVGLKAAPENYSRDIILRQLKQLEAYGVTTVMALGLNGPLFYELRPELHAGRLPSADLIGADQGVGAVGGQPSAAVVPVAENQVSRPDTVERARESIRQMAARKTDMVKIWLDGAGGLMPKVPPEVYSAVIDEAHKNGLWVAPHIYDLDDAKAIVRAGIDIVAHGVRDKAVDTEFIDMDESAIGLVHFHHRTRLHRLRFRGAAVLDARAISPARVASGGSRAIR
jgi:hypothetical protein